MSTLHKADSGTTDWEEIEQSSIPEGEEAPVSNWTDRLARGKLYLTDDCVEALPDNFNLKWRGRLAERAIPTSAETLLNLLDCLGCIDTVIIGAIGFGAVAFELSGFCGAGFTSSKIDPGTGRVMGAGSIVFGMRNDDMPISTPAADYRFPTLYDSGKADFVMVPDQYYYLPYLVPASDADLLIGATLQGETHTALEFDWKFKGVAQDLNFHQAIQGMPDGATIIDALCEVTITGEILYGSEHWTALVNNDFSGDFFTPPEAPSYESESYTDSTPRLGLAFAGQTVDGNWTGLGAAIDEAASATVAGGYKRVIHIKNVIEKMLTLRDSQWARIVIYPAFLQAAQVDNFLEQLNDTFGFLDSVRQGYMSISSSFHSTETHGALSLDWHAVEYRAHLFQLNGGAVAITNAVFQFKLPDGRTQEFRLQPGGALPPLVDA